MKSQIYSLFHLTYGRNRWSYLRAGPDLTASKPCEAHTKNTNFSLLVFSEPKRELTREIRKIALEGVKPDAYMRTLLTVLRSVDNYYSFDDPFLERHFSINEYKAAKATIKQVVMYNA